MPDETLTAVPASDVLAKIKANQPAEFDNCAIVGDLDLSALKIEVPVHFNHTFFQNSVRFSSTTFNSDAYFKNTKFNGYAYFWGSKFNSTADFTLSQFNSTAYFENTKFNSTAYFSGSKFNSDAYFWGSKFIIINFIGTQFDKEAQFDDAQFNGTTSFNNSRFVGDALFQGTTFRKMLYLTRTKYDKLFIRWTNINKQGKLGYDDTAYLLLIKNFRNLGFFEDADECYYQYRTAHLSYVWAPYWPLDAGALILYGYGVKPLYPLIWAIVFFLLFGFIYWIKNLGFSAREALKFSAIVLLSGTGPVLSISSNPTRAGKYKNLARLEKILGSLLFALFLIALGKAILREVI